MGIRIIIGHTNMDLDCIGSIVLARYIYPHHLPVRSRLIHPMARGLYNLYQNQLNFLSIEDIKGETLDGVIIVDTRSYPRVREVLELFPNHGREIEIYDHHTAETHDFPGAKVHEEEYGANTTLIGMELIARGIRVNGDDATMALAGIFADTGNFTHPNVSDADFRVAAYLMECGASTKILSSYMKALKEDHQIELFHEIVNQMVYQEINGHFIIFSFIVLEKQAGGLAAVVEKLSEVENPDAMFGIFYFKNDSSVLLVARSKSDDIDCESITGHFGGGGHPRASSALIKNAGGRDVLESLLAMLQLQLKPALSAGALMQKDVLCINESWSMMEASKFLERIDHNGAPVLNESGCLSGILTLKDIMKARKSSQMKAPVKAYMKTKLITCTEDTTLRRIEDILYRNNIGHLPVMRDGRMVGFLTRSDLLRVAQQ